VCPSGSKSLTDSIFKPISITRFGENGVICLHVSWLDKHSCRQFCKNEKELSELGSEGTSFLFRRDLQEGVGSLNWVRPRTLFKKTGHYLRLYRFRPYQCHPHK